MHDHLNLRSRRSQLLLAAAMLASTIAIAACGSHVPSASTPNRSATSTGSTQTFSKCMRANGVPNFPDLSRSGILTQGSGQTITVNGITVNAPAYMAARAKCHQYLQSIPASPTQAVQQQQRGLKFAKCMRNHGVPNFPDPKVLSRSGGNAVVYLPGVNLQSPAVRSAAKACGGGPKGP